AERRDPAVVPGEVGDVVGREAERDAEDPRDPGERVERGRGGGHERGATSPARRDLRRRPRGVVAVVTAAARLARARGAAHEPPGRGDEQRAAREERHLEQRPGADEVLERRTHHRVERGHDERDRQVAEAREDRGVGEGEDAETDDGGRRDGERAVAARDGPVPAAEPRAQRRGGPDAPEHGGNGVSVAPGTGVRTPNERSSAWPTASVPPVRVTASAARPPAAHRTAAAGPTQRPRGTSDARAGGAAPGGALADRKRVV